MYNKYLSDINFDNSKLINSHRQPEVIFTTSPATPGEYTFTMELTTNGETFTTTFTKKFEQSELIKTDDYPTKGSHQFFLTSTSYT